MARINFAIAINRLSDKREERERELRAEGSTDEDNICRDEQVSHAEEGLDI